VQFTADAPGTADPIGQNFFSTVDDSGTPPISQPTTEGNADGDGGDNNSWTVTTTDLVGSCPIDVRISADSDDSEERISTGAIDWTSTDLELGEENGNAQIVGMRFPDLAIPQGATITNAYIQYTVDEPGSAATNLTFSGELTVNAATFQDFPYNLSPRLANNTAASVDWSTVPDWITAGDAGLDQRTPDLSSIIQEIVNQGTWSRGNALVIFVTGTGVRAAAPLLHVECSAAATGDISGTVFEDVNGDGNLGDAVARPSVDVILYSDGGDGQPDGVDDVVDDSATTDGSGNYAFAGKNNGTYWVVVDSKTVTPSAGTAAPGDVWAEQTYGASGARCDDGTGTTVELGVAGTCYGGQVGITSDDASALTGAEHVTRVVVAGANVSGVNFGFSFNAVTNTLAGDAQDDDLAANRTVQGSLRQFIQNANAVTGANTMRFVPAVPTNDTAGANNWWEVTVTSQLPAVTDAFTTINGTAYSFSDGTSLRDTNPGLLGSGGTVGVDGLVLDQVAATELEIAGVNTVDYGIRIETDDVQVRNLAIYGFGNTDQEGNIWVQDGYRNAWIEGNLIGSEAGGFSDPGAGLRTMGIGIYVSGADDGTIRNNLIGYTVSGGIYITGLGVASTGWLIEDNEVRRNGIGSTNLDGIAVEDLAGTATIRGNLIWESDAIGIDTWDGSGSNIIENNTITRNGIGTAVTDEIFGVALLVNGNTVDRNIIFENYGAGILVLENAVGNTITKNSIYDNGTILNNGGSGPTGLIGINLVATGDPNPFGSSPYVTQNDDGDGDTGGNNLLNFPVIQSASIISGNLVLKGFSPASADIEFFIADVGPNPSPNPFAFDFGEGQTYLTTLTEGSGSDTNAGIGSYSNDNGSESAANRFEFTIPVPGGVVAGSRLTATATDAGNNTSEFGGVVTVLLDGMNAHWPLDEAAGLTADEIILNNDGTYRNGVTLNQPGACGATGTAVSFNRPLSQYVEIPHSDAYLLDEGTVTFWAQATGTASPQGLFSKDSTNNDTGGHLTYHE
jgi:parallel beta-helix repeat protein